MPTDLTQSMVGGSLNTVGKDVGTTWLQNNANFLSALELDGDLNTINVDTFFYTSLANPLNWNQYFPYQIMILQETNSTRSWTNWILFFTEYFLYNLQ